MDMYQKREQRKNKAQQEGAQEVFTKTCINWYPGHMVKAKREMREKLDLIDVVYEVIDARMPIASKIVDIDQLIQKKPRILIVTKYDLCDPKKTDLLLEKYRQEGYCVICVDLMSGENVSQIVNQTLLLSKAMNEKRKDRGMRPRSIRALIVGVPNVGKSTLINRLVGKKAAQVGNRPGITKQVSWIRIHKDIELLDSPGILWPKFENQDHAFQLAALSSIREEILPLSEVAFYIIKQMVELYPERIKARYDITSCTEETFDVVIEAIAKKRGALSKGGVSDEEKVYRIILKDLQEGYFGRITLGS